MSPARTFTVFHGNLDFSAIPDRDLPTVIARCYWPLLRLSEEARLPLGIEMPARTLHRVAREDPEWLKALRASIERGLIEIVGSGLAQVIGPLVPVDINRANLALGSESYASLLGEPPTTWFVNEQTFSPGLAPLYHEVGARALVMEWNNPATHRPELRPLRFRPAQVECGDVAPLPLLWNDSVLFQKLQRVAHGEIPAADYHTMLARAAAPSHETLVCAYGGDLEIFDYRPGFSTPAGAAEGREMARLGASLRALAADSRFSFRLPRNARAGMEPGPVVSLASAADPLPCKKQPRYNPTRWAVSGRGGLGMNTRCFSLRRELRALSALRTRSGQPDEVRDRAELEALVTFWGSDYRTRATEEKIDRFHARMGSARLRARLALSRLVPAPVDDETVVLVNASADPWTGHPVEIPLRLAPGRFASVRGVIDGGTRDADRQQIEVHGRHGDGSIRRATLVLEPWLAPGEVVRVRLARADARGIRHARVAPDSLVTDAVEARFLLHRGGALASLSFSAIGSEPLAGTISHGSFDDVAYAPDFYSAHVVAVTADGGKATDLAPAEACLVSDGPVRSALALRQRTRLGDWTKLYRVYHREPRLDVVSSLRFAEERLDSLRLGTLTLLPRAFDRSTLFYAAVNGGDAVERHALGSGVSLDMGRAVSPSVSAGSCLGATEGFVAVGDAQRVIGIVGDRGQQAVVPLVEFAEVDDSFFLRVQHTAAERDETTAVFFRGLCRYAFAIVGDDARLERIRSTAHAVSRGLVYRTAGAVGFTRGI